MPAVSVIMSTYNDDKYLEQAIKSVLAQDYKDYEFIIIDDASSDNTEKILDKYASFNPMIKVLRNETNAGLVKNLNKALNLAQGAYIARIDSNDEWTDSAKLSTQVNFLNHNADHGLVGSWGIAVDQANGRRTPWLPPVTDDAIRKQILMRNCFLGVSVLFRKSLAKDGYKQLYLQDYEMALRIGKVSKFANIGKIMVDFKINDRGILHKRNSQAIKEAQQIAYAFKNDYPNYAASSVKWWFHRFSVFLIGAPAWHRFKSILKF